MSQGRIFTDPSCPELSPAERRQVYQAFPATLAALHSVRPADVGLLQFGRAGGYAKRQVRGPSTIPGRARGYKMGPVVILSHARGYERGLVTIPCCAGGCAQCWASRPCPDASA